MTKQILRLPEVRKQTGLPTSTLYARISDNTFPKPISLGARSVGWLKEEVDAWIDERVNQSRVLNGGA